MSTLYESRLRIEHGLMQRLQTSEVSKYLQVFYRERGGNDEWIPIMRSPSSPLYPEQFKVVYTFPRMYVENGKLVYNWTYAVTFAVNEQILMNPHSTMGVTIENGSFPAGMMPFNNHITRTFICCGSAWELAQQGYGMYYFVICVGCVLNMDPFIMADGGHLNVQALNFWKTQLHKRPINNIKWPFDLKNRPAIKVGMAQASQKPKITIGKINL